MLLIFILEKEYTNLTTNMRTQTNQIDYANYILDVGEGKLNNENDQVKLKEEMVFKGKYFYFTNN